MQKNSLLAGAALGIALGITGLSFADVKESTPAVQAETIPLLGKFNVKKFTLKNGLRILVVEDHSSPTFAYQTWFKVGSRDESVGRTGLAHLFEHMMFKETKNLKDGQFDKILESAGAEGENAFTSRDYTAYVQELPSDKLDLIMRLESDRMNNLVVDEKAFKTETEVVQNERRFRTENSPDGLMYQEMFEIAFKKHPYHWPVIGYQSDLDAMKGQDALNFYKAFYSPNHATVIIVGDVNPDQVVALAQKHYGELKPQESPKQTIDAEPPQESPIRKTMKLNIQVEKLMVGYHIPGVLDADIPALDVLSTVLSGGKSSRLNRALVETGIATGAETYDLEDKDPSLFIFAANLQKGKKATQAEKIILREIEQLQKQKVGLAELDRAKNQANFSFYEGMNSNTRKARFLGHYEAVAGDFTRGLEHQKKISAVTADEVQAVAKKYFTANNRTSITGVQK